MSTISPERSNKYPCKYRSVDSVNQVSVAPPHCKTVRGVCVHKLYHQIMSQTRQSLSLSSSVSQTETAAAAPAHAERGGPADIGHVHVHLHAHCFPSECKMCKCECNAKHAHAHAACMHVLQCTCMHVYLMVNGGDEHAFPLRAGAALHTDEP